MKAYIPSTTQIAMVFVKKKKIFFVENYQLSKLCL